jgi:hypothetical protein
MPNGLAFTSGRVMIALAAVWCNARLGGSDEVLQRSKALRRKRHHYRPKREQRLRAGLREIYLALRNDEATGVCIDFSEWSSRTRRATNSPTMFANASTHVSNYA